MPGRFSHVLIEHVGLLRVFVSCRAISVKSRNGSFLLIHQFYGLPQLFGIVWIEVSTIIDIIIHNNGVDESLLNSDSSTPNEDC